MNLVKHRSSSRNQRGFTLIELLVAIAISGLVLVGIGTFLTNSMVDNSIRGARADLLREAQLSLDILTRDIRLSANADEANRIEDLHSPNAAATNGRGWLSGSDVLVLATAAEDNDRNIIFQDATHYITEKNNIVYFVEDGTLYKRTLALDVPNNRLSTSCPEADDDDCRADIQLVEGVAAFQIRYYSNINEEVEPARARSIELTLSLQKIKFGREVNAEYTTRTVFRNE